MWHRRHVWNEDGIAEELTAMGIGGCQNILDTRTRWGENGGSINLESVESSVEKARKSPCNRYLGKERMV